MPALGAFLSVTMSIRARNSWLFVCVVVCCGLTLVGGGGGGGGGGSVRVTNYRTPHPHGETFTTNNYRYTLRVSQLYIISVIQHLSMFSQLVLLHQSKMEKTSIIVELPNWYYSCFLFYESAMFSC